MPESNNKYIGEVWTKWRRGGEWSKNEEEIFWRKTQVGKTYRL